MGNSLEKLENRDMNDESSESSADKSKRTEKDIRKSPESETEAEIIDLNKRREEILQERNKPTQTTSDTQRDRTTETMQRSAEEEEMEMEKELLYEQLDKGGLKLTEEEIQTLYEAIPDLVNGISPEFSKYVTDMMSRMEKVLPETERLTLEGNEYKAVEKLSEFLGQEMNYMEKIKDETARNQILAFINATIDIEKVIEDMNKQTKVEGATELIKIVPVLGPGLDLAEAARGKSTAGEKLSGGQRVKRATVGTAFMVMDVAGLVTAGSTTAVRAGISAAKAGKGIKDVAQAASAAYTTAKAAEKAAKVTTLAARGAKIGKSVTKFAALTRKTTKLKRLSNTIYKVGKLIRKYPRLAGVISRTISIRSTYKTGRDRLSLVGKEVKAVSLAHKVKNITHPDKDLPKAA